MEAVDRRLLRELQSNSQRSIAQIGERVGLSSSACHRRVRALEEAGAIEGYGARISAEAVGLAIHALIDISLESQRREVMEDFEAAVSRSPDVLECYLISGMADYRLTVAARDMADYDRLHRECLASLPGVRSMHTSFLIRPIKNWSGYSNI